MRGRIRRAYSIRTLTLGVREQVQITGQLLPLIEWRWWCRGRLRLIWIDEAAKDATSYFRWEVGADEAERVSGGKRRLPRPLDPQKDRTASRATACDFAVVFGGTPDEWRRVRWRDARYMWAIHFWRETPPDKRGERPVWGRRNGAA